MLIKIFITILISFQFLVLSRVNLVLAQQPSCTLNSISPSSIGTNVTTNVTFHVSNNLNFSLAWVKLISDSDLYTLSNPSSSGWSGTVDSNTEVSFSGGSMVQGSGGDFSIAIQSGPDELSEAWHAQVSASSDGSGAVNCGNTPTLSVVADTTQPEISNITVSNITTTSVKINWNTDKATTSKVLYGPTENFGSEAAGGTNATSHSVTLNGLSSYTIYHFRIEATDSIGNSANSSNSTFTTAREGSSTSPSPTSTTTIVIATPIPTIAPKPDKQAPKVTVTTDFTKPYRNAPTIAGKATDDKEVASVSYSTDGGKSWLAVDKIDKAGAKQVSFSFTPYFFDEGNYAVRVRAIDASGNTGQSVLLNLILDRLVPLVGGSLVSIGPQVLEPLDNGNYYALAGVDEKITLSAVGGPTKITLFAQSGGIKKEFPMAKSQESGLWTATVNLLAQGYYVFSATAVDGVLNTTTRTLYTVSVIQPGFVKELNSKLPLSGTMVTLYYKEPTTNVWTVWDAKPFGQKNPQVTNSSGTYQFLAPPGTYYMNLTHPFYRDAQSTIFTLFKTSPINIEFSLQKQAGINLGFITLPFFDFAVDTVTLKMDTPQKSGENGSSLLGKEAPLFSLPTTSNSPFSLLLTRGKPHILTFINTWVPAASEQIAILNKATIEEGIPTTVIVPSETASSLSVFVRRGEYKTPLVIDSDATLVQRYNLSTVPTHYFLDRKGIVTKAVVGLLSKQQIEEYLQESGQ